MKITCANPISWAVRFVAMLALAGLANLPLPAAEWASESLPRYEALFQRTNGWLGADGDFTVTLAEPGINSPSNGTVLWLFSDTFVGKLIDGHRRNTTMINNSAAWQRGFDPEHTDIRFFLKHQAQDKPASLITPADGKGWFWLMAGVMEHSRLYLFLAQIESTGQGGAFGFHQVDAWLGEVSNPLTVPTRWDIKQRRVPFGQFETDEYRTWGAAVLATNGFVYVYGVHERPGHGGKKMILARVPDTNPADFSAWQFRTGDGWSTNAAAAADLCNGIANEYSVSWLPAAQQYVLICTENGLSDKIMARTAPEPWGPWSAPKTVYRCPEMSWSKGIFCYAAKAHPMLARRPDELIVTYAANAFDIPQIMNDSRLYWPRFVRVKLIGN